MKKPKTETEKTKSNPQADLLDAKNSASGEATDTEADPTQEGESDSNVELEELRSKAAKADEAWDRLLRTTAEFDNFRKRAAREKDEAIRFANHKLLERLLPVLDSFEMAVAAANTANGDSSKSLKDGIELVHQQLRSVLAESGLEEIDAQGKPFDPNVHEAVSQIETAEIEEGLVAHQLRKGYLLKDRLVRPSTVVVAKKPSA